MKKYVSPSANVIELDIADIITLSAPDDLADFDDTAVAPPLGSTNICNQSIKIS